MESILSTFSLTRDDALMIPIFCVLFFAFWRLLAHSVFGPFIQLVEAREKLTEGDAHLAEHKKAQSEKLVAQYEEALNEARALAMKEKQQILSQAKSEAQKIIDAAQKTAQEFQQSSRESLQQSLKVLEQQTFGKVDELSTLLADKVVSLQ